MYEPVIGMEVHVELNTASKMFCSCPNSFGDEPNSNVCPVCMGSPGVLPVMNRQAYDFAVRTGLALNCTIASFTKWDRKSYYYPDLPKNYQISQYDLPIGSDGTFEIPDSADLLRCVGGARACPPEDCGGPASYEEILSGVHELQDAFPDLDPESFDCTGVVFTDPDERWDYAFGEEE